MSLFATPATGDASRPNLLVIVSDDQGRWAMGDYDPRIHTPNLSHIAAQGVRFDRVIAPTPVCSAARVSLYTGRTPSQHGVHDFLSEAEGESTDWLADEVLISEHLQAAGYRVGLFGKWHASNRGWETARGFDRWLSYDERDVGWQNQYLHSGEVFYASDGEPISFTGVQADFISASVAAFMREEDDRPFAAFVNFVEPHFPFEGLPERLVARYRTAIAGQLAPPGDFSDLAPKFENTRTREQQVESMAQYLAAVSLLDEKVGELTDVLETVPGLANTVVVYTSDHGHMTGQYGLWGKGNATVPQNLYDYSLDVPLIVKGPPAYVAAGQVREEFVTLMDLFPTLLNWAGAESALADYDGPGKSLAPLLQGARPLAFRDYQFAEYGNARMVSNGRWKLVRYYQPEDKAPLDRWFDLQHPQGERRPSPAPSASIQKRLVSAMESHFSRHESPEHSGRKIWSLPRHNGMEPWRP